MELEWGDNIERNANEEEEAMGNTDEEEEAVEVVMEGRNRRPPVWMTDYTSGEDLSEEDEANMALMMSSDPTSFEEAIKSSKWKLAMDEHRKKSDLALGGTTY